MKKRLLISVCCIASGVVTLIYFNSSNSKNNISFNESLVEKSLLEGTNSNVNIVQTTTPTIVTNDFINKKLNNYSTNSSVNTNHLLEENHFEKQVNRTKNKIESTILKLNNILEEKNIELKEVKVSLEEKNRNDKRLDELKNEISRINSY